MRIAVCLKQVLTRESQIRIDDSRLRVRDEHASWELNEPDAYALEEALRLREKHGGEVIAVSAGPARVTAVLREALARGADSAIHVAGDHLAASDALVTASALAAALREVPADLILTGLQSDDHGHAQVGVMLAELLDRPHASIVMAVEIANGSLRAKRELEGGWFQWIAMPLPAVLTIQSGINQLRYATLKGIMAAKKKELKTVLAPAVSAASYRVRSLALSSRERHVRLFEGPAGEAARSLIAALRDEARAIER